VDNLQRVDLSPFEKQPAARLMRKSSPTQRKWPSGLAKSHFNYRCASAQSPAFKIRTGPCHERSFKLVELAQLGDEQRQLSCMEAQRVTI